MRPPSKITREQIEEIREAYQRPGVTWADLTAKYGLSKARLYQLLNPEAYWRSLRRRADRELKKLWAERDSAFHNRGQRSG